MAAYNGGITVWDLVDRADKKNQALDLPHEGGACLCVDASSDAQWVVTGCHDACLKIFHLEEKQGEGIHVSQLNCGGYESKVRLVDFHPEDRWLASSGGNQSIIWNFERSPNGSIPTMAVGHSKSITCQAWQHSKGEFWKDEDGNAMSILATGGKSGMVLVYNVDMISQVGKPNLCCTLYSHREYIVCPPQTAEKRAIMPVFMYMHI